MIEYRELLFKTKQEQKNGCLVVISANDGMRFRTPNIQFCPHFLQIAIIETSRDACFLNCESEYISEYIINISF